MIAVADISLIVFLFFALVFSVILFVKMAFGKKSSQTFQTFQNSFRVVFSGAAFLSFLIICYTFLKNGSSGGVVDAFGTYLIRDNFIEGLFKALSGLVVSYSILYGTIRALNTPTRHSSIFKIGDILHTPRELFFLVPKFLLILVALCSFIAIPYFSMSRGMEMVVSIRLLSVLSCGCLAIFSIFSLYFSAEFLSEVAQKNTCDLTSQFSFSTFIKYTTCRIAIILVVMNLLYALIPGLPGELAPVRFVIFLSAFFLSLYGLKKLNASSSKIDLAPLIAAFIIALMNFSMISCVYLILNFNFVRARARL